MLPKAEAQLTFIDNVTLRFNSMLMYGEDIRDQLLLPDIGLYGQMLLFISLPASGYSALYVIRRFLIFYQ